MEYKNIPIDDRIDPRFYNLIDMKKMYSDFGYYLKEYPEDIIQNAIDEYVYDDSTIAPSIVSKDAFHYDIVKNMYEEAIKNRSNPYIYNQYDMNIFVVEYILDEIIYMHIAETFVYNMLVDYINKNNLDYSENFVEMVAIDLDYSNSWKDESKRLIENLLTW